MIPALATRRLDADLACGALPARARARPRHGHAGPRSRSPERRPVQDARGCHVRLDAVPPDRRLDRRLDLRRDLRQPTCDGTRRATTARCPCPGRSEPGDRPSPPGRDPAAVHRSGHGGDHTDLPRRRRIRDRRLPAHLAPARGAAPRDRRLRKGSARASPHRARTARTENSSGSSARSRAADARPISIDGSSRNPIVELTPAEAWLLGRLATVGTPRTHAATVHDAGGGRRAHRRSAPSRLPDDRPPTTANSS